MRYELVQLYLKDNDYQLYCSIENYYQKAKKLKELAYVMVGYAYEKEIKKYIKKLIKNL